MGTGLCWRRNCECFGPQLCLDFRHVLCCLALDTYFRNHLLQSKLPLHPLSFSLHKGRQCTSTRDILFWSEVLQYKGKKNGLGLGLGGDALQIGQGKTYFRVSCLQNIGGRTTLLASLPGLLHFFFVCIQHMQWIIHINLWQVFSNGNWVDYIATHLWTLVWTDHSLYKTTNMILWIFKLWYFR